MVYTFQVMRHVHSTIISAAESPSRGLAKSFKAWSCSSLSASSLMA
jgi:hypothetical protein